MTKLALAAFLALGLAACNQAPETDGNAATSPEIATQTLGAMIATDARLSGASELLRAANLNTVLTGPGPYTVFVPSNRAIELLPADVVARLKTEAARPQLVALVTGHIVPGTVTAADLARAVDSDGTAQLRTTAGDILSVTRVGDDFTVAAPGGEPVRISGLDRGASNGVAHVIDAVLVRP